MCNPCGKCRLNNQLKDSFVSTRAWFILLNVCSHVGPVQLEFGTSSFCLFLSREWNSDALFVLSFFFSSPPITRVVNWRTNICLSWSNTFLYSAESSFFIQLCNCSVHLKIQKKAQGPSSQKQNCYELGWWIEMHMAEAWQWEGMWGAEVSKAVLTLPQPCNAKGSSMVIADKC